MALGDEPLNHGDHRTDLLGGAGTDVGVFDAEAVHDVDKSVGARGGHLLGRHPTLVGALDDLVVDVGEVLGEGHLVAAVGKPAADDVEGEEGAGVADVDVVVDGGAAHVHADLAGNEGFEVDLGAPGGVVELHGLVLLLGRGGVFVGVEAV